MSNETPLLLATLGNLGHPEQTQVLLPFLHSANEAWRERAADALRFVATDAAVDRLVQTATADVSIGVRRAAVGALSYQQPSEALLNFYAERVNAETADTVLKQILHNLAIMTGQLPQAQQTLQHYVAHCQSVDLCDYARSLSQTI